MNYHRQIAKFLTASHVVIFSEGLDAAQTVYYMSFSKILVCSYQYNDVYKTPPEERQKMYLARSVVHVPPSLVQIDVLTRILMLNDFECIVSVDPDYYTVNLLNYLQHFYSKPIVLLLNSPLQLIHCTSISDMYISYKLYIKLALDRLVLVPRIETSVNAELQENKSVFQEFKNPAFELVREEIFQLIKKYCQLGKDEYCMQVARMDYYKFVCSPYIFTSLKFVYNMLHLLEKLEFVSAISVPALLDEAIELIDSQAFEFRYFDFSLVRYRFEVIKSIVSSSNFTGVGEQLADILLDYDDASVIFPSKWSLDYFFSITSCYKENLPDYMINPRHRVRFYCAYDFVSFKPKITQIEPFRPNTVVIAYAPPLSFARHLEKVSSQIEQLFLLKTPFLSNFTEAAAKFEYAAFSLLRTFRYKHQIRHEIQSPNMIYVDGREVRCPIPIQLKVHGMDVVVGHLKTADYILSPECGVERKAEQDLLGSISDRRMFYQLERLQMSFYRSFLLCESGFQHPIYKDQRALELLCGALIRFPGVTLVWAHDPASYLVNLSKAFGEREFTIDDLQPSDNAAFPKFLRSLSCLRARERALIMQHYKCIRELVLDSQAELREALGIYLADKLWSVFTAKIRKPAEPEEQSLH